MGGVLALASAVSYGIADYAGGLLARRANAGVVALLGQLGALVVTFGAAAVVTAEAVTAADVAWGTASGVGTGVGMVFLYRGMSRGDMSAVVPISAVASVALSVLVGVLLLGDRPNLLVWAGIAIAVPALWLVAGSMPGKLFSGAAMDGFAASGAIAVQYLALAQVSVASGIWPVAFGRIAATVAIALFVLVELRRCRLDTTWWNATLAASTGLPIALALVLYLVATRTQEVAIAVVLASLYPVIPVVLGITLLRERLTAGRALGLVGTALAIPMLTLG